MSTRPTLLVSVTLSLCAAVVLPSRAAFADDGFAEPPPNQQVAADPPERPMPETEIPAPAEDASVMRIMVGPAGKFDASSVSPGLFVATEFGRGPAGVRFSGAWLDVGSPQGVAQYTGELTVDFGGQSHLHPVLGAGGGVARTSSSTDDKGNVDLKDGATLGIGVVRAGLGVRLPFRDTDARVAVDVSGVFPAIRPDDAPKGITPWALASLGVVVGF